MVRPWVLGVGKTESTLRGRGEHFRERVADRQRLSFALAYLPQVRRRSMPEIWLTVDQYAELRGVSPQAVRKGIRSAIRKRSTQPIVRQMKGRGGRSGIRYEVLLASLPKPFQDRFSALSEPAENRLNDHLPTPEKFFAAVNQTDEERRKWAALRLVSETEPRTEARAEAIRQASHHHDVPVRTLQPWVKRCDDHGWDLDALGRKKPSDSGKPRVVVSRAFDRCWRASGYAEDELLELRNWVTRDLAGWWQSPVQRTGWKAIRREALHDLRRECRERGKELPDEAFHLSRRRIEELRFHSVVDEMENDAKRFDDMKPRIRRDNSRFEPMEQVVMDVKPIDCVVLRPDGSEACPKFIAFLDTGTMRMTGRMLLLPKGEGVRQEHVTDSFIAMATNPHWGFPQQLYRDNGSEYAHFDLIREALQMTAREGVRVIINAKPYSGASKPIESRFAVMDRYVTSQMQGYIGPNRMNKKTQRVGKKVKPYPGTIEEFEAEFFMRLADWETIEFGSGPFKGRSPNEIYLDHLERGWRPVSVHPLALDAAFAKKIGERKVDRGTLTIGPDRYRHTELAAYVGQKVNVVQPYRRSAWPLAELPGIGWVALEPEMPHLPGDISGAHEASQMQKKRTRAVRRLKSEAASPNPLQNVEDRVATLPTAAAPAPLMDVLMSPEAERFAGARIEAEKRRSQQPSAEERLRARLDAEDQLLEKQYGKRRD